MENIDDFTTCRSINVNSANSMKPCRKPLYQIMTNRSIILKEKEDQMFVSLKIIKNIIIKLNIIYKLLIVIYKLFHTSHNVWQE